MNQSNFWYTTPLRREKKSRGKCITVQSPCLWGWKTKLSCVLLYTFPKVPTLNIDYLCYQKRSCHLKRRKEIMQEVRRGLQPGLPRADDIPSFTPEVQALREPHACRVLGACLFDTWQSMFPSRGTGPLPCRRLASLASNPEKAAGLPVSIPALLLLLLSHFSRVRLCVTPRTAAHQAPPSLGFSRQEHWSGLPFPSPMHESEKWKWRCSVVSDPQRPPGLQPSRLLHPWDFPGKSTGVGCHCLLRFYP